MEQNKTAFVHKSRGGIPSQWYNNTSNPQQNGYVKNHPNSSNNSESKNIQTNNSTQQQQSSSTSASGSTVKSTSTSPTTSTSMSTSTSTQILAEELNALIRCAEDEERKTGVAIAQPDLVQSSYLHNSAELGTPVQHVQIFFHRSFGGNWFFANLWLRCFCLSFIFVSVVFTGLFYNIYRSINMPPCLQCTFHTPNNLYQHQPSPACPVFTGFHSDVL